MMPCNPHAATALLPTMSPFMRAGMKCEGLGINSATELWPCRGPVPLSEAQMDRGARQVTQGAVWVSTRHFRLFVCLSLLQPAGLRSSDRQTPLVAWHLPASASEPLIQSWCPSALSHTTGTAPAVHAKRESLFTSWTAKPVQATSLARRSSPRGVCTALEPCQPGGTCLSKRSSLRAPGSLPGLAAPACSGQLAGEADKVHVLANTLLSASMILKHIMAAVPPKHGLEPARPLPCSWVHSGAPIARSWQLRTWGGDCIWFSKARKCRSRSTGKLSGVARVGE